MNCETLETTLVTERLILRPPHSGDARRIAAIINDPGVTRMTTKIPYPFRLADAEAFCAASSDGELKIETRAGQLVGGVGVQNLDQAVPEIGYWIGRPFWGQGLATEAVGAVLDWVRRKRGRRAMAAGHFSDNYASGRVLIKSGFLYTGDIQHRFSISRGETAATRMMIWLP